MSRRPSLRNRRSSSMDLYNEYSFKKNIFNKNIISHNTPSCIDITDSPSHPGNVRNAPEVEAVTRKGNNSLKRFIKPVLFTTVFIVIAVILVVFLLPKSDTVCFIRVGCFSISGPWAERPNALNFVPQSPSVINTTFFVTSRQDPTAQYGTIKIPNFGSSRVLNEAHIPWNTSSIIVFLVHGFTDRSGTWMQTLKNAFLAQAEDIIVVLVDWEAGAAGTFRYPQVVANTRVVAREITLFIRHIQRRFGSVSPKRVHLVGHSLGSQISSYVGKSLANSSYSIHQITALDPAYPLFEGYSPEIRLHKSDARHVLAIHSNIAPLPALGMKNPAGTIDIYLNDGRNQRGCLRLGGIVKENDDEDEEELTSLKFDNKSQSRVFDSLFNLVDDLACSHRRAYVWLEDVLRDLAGTLWVHSTHHLPSTTVIGYPFRRRNNTDIAKLARNRRIHFSHCQESGEHGCWKLEKDVKEGFFRLPSPHHSINDSLTFFIPTTDKSPFCVKYAYLEMSVCQLFSSHIAPLLGGRGNVEARAAAAKNIALTMYQSAFDEEVLVCRGSINDRTQLHAWVEFPCEALQHVRTNKKSGDNYHDQNFLSVKLRVSIEEIVSTKKAEGVKNSGKSLRTTNGNNDTRASPGLCVNQLRLTYFNETKKDIVRLNWQKDKQKGHGAQQTFTISSKECVELKFPL